MQDALKSRSSSISPRFDTRGSVLHFVRGSVSHFARQFQRLCEQLYENPEWPKARRNAFQNLDAGSDLWEQALGFRYVQLLTPTEMADVVRYFQQRHLLAHQQGIVDADYISRSGDSSYLPGQRLIIKPTAVLQFVDLVDKLGKELLART